MSNKIYNWGILAPGRIAHKFTQDLITLPNARLHAVASRSLDRAKAFSAQYGGTHAFGSYEDLVNCPDLDVVYIATPHTGHHENTLLCLKNNLAVLCEKPMGINRQQVEEMVATAKKQNTYLMEAIWTRFLPATLKALKLIDQEVIGDVLTLRADFGFKAPYDPQSRLFNADLAGGALLDVGIYPVFLSQLLFGKPEKIKATAKIGETGVDETNAMIFSYKNGQTAILDSSIIMTTPCVAEIYGTKGTITIHGRWHESQELSVQLYQGDTQYFTFQFAGNGYYAETLAVMQDLAAGKKENDWLTHQFSLDLINLLDQVQRVW